MEYKYRGCVDDQPRFPSFFPLSLITLSLHLPLSPRPFASFIHDSPESLAVGDRCAPTNGAASPISSQGVDSPRFHHNFRCDLPCRRTVMLWAFQNLRASDELAEELKIGT